MKSILVAFILLIFGNLFAQKADSSDFIKSRFALKASLVLSGDLNVSFSTPEWEKMTPGFQIPDSLSSTSSNPPQQMKTPIRFSNTGTWMFSVSYIHSKPQKKFQASTNFYIGSGPSINGVRSWGLEKRFVIDTLTSGANGNQYYVWGNRSTSVMKNYYSRTLLVGFGERIATNPARVFQFETGIDILLFFGVYRGVAVSSMDSFTVENAPADYVYQAPLLNESMHQDFSAPLLSGMLLRVPLDFSFKLSKKRNVLKNMRIGWELNPAINTLFSSERSDRVFHFSSGFNFRYRF